MAEVNLEEIIYEAQRIYKANAPVRTKPLGRTKTSPYPGNLKNNAIIVKVKNENDAELVLSKEAASYIDYTETRSHKKGWQNKSFNELVSTICAKYGGRLG
jgi:hypothetical protein